MIIKINKNKVKVYKVIPDPECITFNLLYVHQFIKAHDHQEFDECRRLDDIEKHTILHCDMQFVAIIDSNILRYNVSYVVGSILIESIMKEHPYLKNPYYASPQFSSSVQKYTAMIFRVHVSMTHIHDDHLIVFNELIY